MGKPLGVQLPPSALFAYRKLYIAYRNDKRLAISKYAGVAQLVERNLAKVDVAGSNPVSRSRL